MNIDPQINPLSSKIQKNKERLELLLQKRDNLEREIQNLETKIVNQEYALKQSRITTKTRVKNSQVKEGSVESFSR